LLQRLLAGVTSSDAGSRISSGRGKEDQEYQHGYCEQYENRSDGALKCEAKH
jgi:hypothetical protein